MYEFISTIVNGTVPAPVAAAVGLFGLGTGLFWMRAAAADKLAKAKEYMAISIRYGTRGDNALARMRAVDTPTQQVDVSELRAAYASPLERLQAWSRDKGEQVREAITPSQDIPDWAEGEMTAAFRRIVADNDWEPSPLAVAPAPAPALAPAVVHAPRGSQTPPRWADGGTPPSRRRTIQSLAPRERSWTSYLRTPELPAFPEPFHVRMPRQRVRVTPAVMARLPEDPTRAYRTRTV